MNPLHASWTRKKRPTKEPKKKGDAPFLGVRNQAQKQAEGVVVVFEVRAVAGLSPGLYKTKYSPGASLRWYLRQLRMLSVASRVAIYDTGAPGRGRLRLRYVPTPASRILLLPPSLSPSTHLQRSPVDAQKVASKMKTNP